MSPILAHWVRSHNRGGQVPVRLAWSNVTRSEFELFLTFAMGLCAVMAVFTLLRSRKRGMSAYFLAAGFVAMGFLLYGFHENWSKPAMAATGAAVAISLAGDFLIRAAAHGQGKH